MDIYGDDRDKADNGTDAQPRVNEADHRDSPDQQHRDTGGVGKRTKDTGPLIDVGIGHRQQVTDGLFVVPGHLERELVCQQFVAHVPASARLQPSCGGATKDDSDRFEGCHANDGSGSDRKEVGLLSLVEDRDDDVVGYPPNHQSRGKNGSSEHGRPKDGDGKGNRVHLDEPPDQPASVTHHGPRCHNSFRHDRTAIYNFKFGLSQGPSPTRPDQGEE